MARYYDLTILVHNTDVQGAGMQVNAAGKWMLFGVESPEVSSSLSLLFPLSADHWGVLRRGPQ
jgi:hypothetical protein